MPRKKNPTPKEILKKIYKEGEVSKSVLRDLGIDHNKLPLKYKNFYVKKNFFGDIKFDVNNKYNDLDDLPIKENEKLIKKVLRNWHAGKKSILFNEMIDLNIFTPLTKFSIGENILLKSDGEDAYNIQRVKKDKDLEGRWENEAITMKRIIDSLREYEFNTKRQRMIEKSLNADLINFFKTKFIIAVKPTRGELVDIAIGKGKNRIFIELKLAKQIKKRDESFIARSQIEEYNKTIPTSNLMLLIAGTKANKQVQYVQDVLDKAKQLKIKTIYLNPE